jgi:hypothetical protein
MVGVFVCVVFIVGEPQEVSKQSTVTQVIMRMRFTILIAYVGIGIFFE